MSLKTPDADTIFQKVKQDVVIYLPEKNADKLLISADKQHAFYKNYLNNYFSPWNNEYLFISKDRIKSIEDKLIDTFLAAPGWGENWRLHSRNWVNEIVQNMNMKTYPNSSQRAITINVAHLRQLPTMEPSFKDQVSSVTDGYPFDRLETSLLPANLPIKVVHMSRDGAWALVITPYNALGWLPLNDFAFVDKDFVQTWQTGDYAAVIKDKLALVDGEQHFLFFGRLGSIQPIIYSAGQYGHDSSYHVLVAVMGLHHQAVFQAIRLSKQDAVTLPMPLTASNVAKIANTILGQPYDWGGHYGYRDCSATLMDIFTPFGIWLPRSSADQAHAGKFTSLTHLNDAEKLAFIKKNAVPFLTFLCFPGHIALYLGQHNNQSFIYHTMWGLSVEYWFKSNTKLVIGKTIIVPLDLSDLPIKTPGFLKRIDGMMNLEPV